MMDEPNYRTCMSFSIFTPAVILHEAWKKLINTLYIKYVTDIDIFQKSIKKPEAYEVGNGRPNAVRPMQMILPRNLIPRISNIISTRLRLKNRYHEYNIDSSRPPRFFTISLSGNSTIMKRRDRYIAEILLLSKRSGAAEVSSQEGWK